MDPTSKGDDSNPKTHKKQKIFSEKQKGFRDGLSYSTPQKSKETRENAISQPRSHPKNVEFWSTQRQEPSQGCDYSIYESDHHLHCRTCICYVSVVRELQSDIQMV